MSNAFVQSMAHNLQQSLRLMEAALTDCPDDRWQKDLWPHEAPTAPAPCGGLHGSAPWFLGYHALTTLDYDLAGEFALSSRLCHAQALSAADPCVASV